MTKAQAIAIHDKLVAIRKREVIANAPDTRLRELDQQIGRYGQAHNARISRKAADFLGFN